MISQKLPSCTPRVTFCCRTAPFSMTKTEETPARVETASWGTARTFSSFWVRMVPFAKNPGLSLPVGLETRISTGKVRVC